MRTDNGTEYFTQKLEEFCRRFGIQHQHSVPYTPEQNGVAKRANSTIVERAKCMLFDAGLEKPYWAEAVHMAVYIINRSASSVLNNQTPEESWTGEKVDIGNIRIFGSPVMVHIPKQKRLKWNPKSQKMLFVGFADNAKGFRRINPESKKLIIARDVKFL